MKLLSARQIREWDQYTIQHEPVSSINLMERAANACAKWLVQNIVSRDYFIFCGKGNNGGDGLAIARILKASGLNVSVFILESGAHGSVDYQVNLKRLQATGIVPIQFMQSESEMPEVPQGNIIVDTLFGTGLNRKLEGTAATLIKHINELNSTVISIDIPSGMLSDASSRSFPIIKAAHTLTFQCLKMAFLVAENEPFFGKVQILDINLHPAYPDTIDTPFYLISKSVVQSLYKPRNAFAHKGNFGHALLVAGSYGKMGAALLSAKACLRSGVGLLTCHVPSCGMEMMQTGNPEAMCKTDKNKKYVSNIGYDLSGYASIGIGPGIDTKNETAKLLYKIIAGYNNPLVIDADALNILALNKDWLAHLPQGAILTPHPKEFSRLFGESLNDFDRIQLALQKSEALNCIIILKGHHSFVALPTGKGYFNITGNAGMATGGSGDVLTGILTGLVAQGYTPANASLLGVFLHGLAGDIAAGKKSMEALVAHDLTDEMGESFKQISI